MEEKKFEEALERLEEIVKKMEEGDMTLEASLDAFEDGINLARFCSKKLDEAKRRVEVLLIDDTGGDIRPFADENENGR